jgi:ABC-type transport system involved in cytochrome c biogenesis permease subunit
MVRINNLFFLYSLVCIGLGIGQTYWDVKTSTYLFIVISTLLVALLIFSRDFYTKEAHFFFLKQAFMTTIITIFCGLITSQSRVFKTIDIAFNHAWIGATTFWIFTIFHRRDHGERNNRRKFNQNNGNTTFA